LLSDVSRDGIFEVGDDVLPRVQFRVVRIGVADEHLVEPV
jgi:hypothetical protein